MHAVAAAFFIADFNAKDVKYAVIKNRFVTTYAVKERLLVSTFGVMVGHWCSLRRPFTCAD